MKKITRFGMLMLIIITVILVVGYQLTFSHEKLHQRIGEEYGVNSTITVKMFGMLGGETNYDQEKYAKLTVEQQDKMKEWNIITEQIDYRLIPLTLLIVGFAIISLIMKVEGNKK